MTGFARVEPHESDYLLWKWLVKRWEVGNLPSEIISNDDLDNYRTEFQISGGT